MIFVPKRINIGFCKRGGTYTGKLAYIIYWDEKGVLRKETSWQNWRDKSIPNEEYDNEPMEGFVLNKKVGDYDSGWNHRHAYTRVYDPRGFEFEITIENLLYILEHCNSIKGKGLEGSFIYGWDGKDLVLLPVDSPDYKEIQKKNEIVHNNKFISKKELEIGCTYRDINGGLYVYLDKSKPWNLVKNFYCSGNTYWNRYKRGWKYPLDDTWIQRRYLDSEDNKYRNEQSKSYTYWFAWLNPKYGNFSVVDIKNPKFVEKVSNSTEKFERYIDELNHKYDYSPYDLGNELLLPMDFEEFSNKVNESKSQNGRVWIYYYEERDKDDFSKRDRKYFDVKYSDGKYIVDDLYEFLTIEDIYNHIKPMNIYSPLMNGTLIKRG